MQETQETWVSSLGWEYPLEEEMATHSSILAREIPWTAKPGGLQSVGWQRIRQDSTDRREKKKNQTDTLALLPSHPSLFLKPAILWLLKERTKVS